MRPQRPKRSLHWAFWSPNERRAGSKPAGADAVASGARLGEADFGDTEELLL